MVFLKYPCFHVFHRGRLFRFHMAKCISKALLFPVHRNEELNVLSFPLEPKSACALGTHKAWCGMFHPMSLLEFGNGLWVSFSTCYFATFTMGHNTEPQTPGQIWNGTGEYGSRGMRVMYVLFSLPETGGGTNFLNHLTWMSRDALKIFIFTAFGIETHWKLNWG